jgi:hypothetical protein
MMIVTPGHYARPVLPRLAGVSPVPAASPAPPTRRQFSKNTFGFSLHRRCCRSDGRFVGPAIRIESFRAIEQADSIFRGSRSTADAMQEVVIPPAETCRIVAAKR